MAVVKADAYGHGAVPCARAAVEAGADCLGVGRVEEGIELREKGLQAPVHVLAGAFPEEIEDLIRYRLAPTLCRESMAEAIHRAAQARGTRLGVHIKVDTGMGRLGVPPEQLPHLVERIRQLKNLRIESIFTHLATADDPDPEYTRFQLTRFREALGVLERKGMALPPVHAANSAALLRHPESQLSLVRTGILLYGALTSPHLEPVWEGIRSSGTPPLQPVMSWKSRIIHLNRIPKGSCLSYGKTYKVSRESRIATLPVGYADGLPRRLSGNLEVLIHGQRAPQVGTICMDLCLVDVTDIPEAREGDTVVLLGEQEGERITVEEMARRAETLPYEILCCVGKRVPRLYKS